MKYFIFFLILSSCSFGKSEKSYNELVSEIFSKIHKNYLFDIGDEEMKKGIAVGLTANLDEYSDFFSKTDYEIYKNNMNGNISGIGVELVRHEDGARIMSVISGSSAEKSKLKTGDIIFKVEKISTDSLSIAKIGRLISGEIGSFVELSIIDGKTGVVKIMIVKRESVFVKSVEVERYEKLPVIKIKYFSDGTFLELKKELEKIKIYNPVGLIFDLSGNPGGSLDSVVKISSIFLDPGSEISSIIWKGGEKYTYLSDGSIFDKFFRKTPIAIVLNEGSASASEIFASSIQQNKRGFIVGGNSFGKGVVQDIFELDSINGAAIKLTVAEYFGPNMVKINKIGVKPDIFCAKKNSCNAIILSRKAILSNY